MNVTALRVQFERLAELYLAGGAKGPANDLKLLADALGANDDRSVSQFRDDVLAALSRPAQGGGRGRSGAAKPASGRVAGGKSAAVDSALVQRHLENLRAADTNQTAFDAAFQQLTADKAVKLATLSEIARLYASTVTKYKSATAARSDIAGAFVRQARFRNKLL